MTRRRTSNRRGRAFAALAAIGLGLVVTACSISPEQTPRPITRETTVVPPTSEAP